MTFLELNGTDAFLILCSFIIISSFFVKDAEFSQALFENLSLCLSKSPNNKYIFSQKYLRPLFSKEPEVLMFLWSQQGNGDRCQTPTSNLLKEGKPYLLFYLDKSHFEKQLN